MKFIVLTITLAFCCSICTASSVSSENIEKVIVETYLNISTGDHKVELAKWQRWDSALSILSKKEKPSTYDLKLFLLALDVAQKKNQIHSQEYLAKIIVERFSTNSKKFLDLIAKLPFFMIPMCTTLKDHFDLYPQKNKRTEFLKKHEVAISSILGKRLGEQCLNLIRKKINP